MTYLLLYFFSYLFSFQSSTHAYEHKVVDSNGNLQARVIHADAVPKSNAPPELFDKSPWL